MRAVWAWLDSCSWCELILLWCGLAAVYLALIIGVAKMCDLGERGAHR